MNKKRAGLIIFFTVFIAWILWLFCFLTIKGKRQDELTNRPQPGMNNMGINRGEEEAVSEDSVSHNGVTVNYRLPENFYFEDEYRDEAHHSKTYYTHNFSVSLEISLYQDHIEDNAQIDTENPDNSVINKGILVDADEWFKEMQLVFLDRIEDTDVRQMNVFGNEVRYFTKYSQNEKGQMQGTLIAMITLNEHYYYCVKAVEFGNDRAPLPEEYENALRIKYKEQTIREKSMAQPLIQGGIEN